MPAEKIEAVTTAVAQQVARTEPARPAGQLTQEQRRTLGGQSNKSAGTNSTAGAVTVSSVKLTRGGVTRAEIEKFFDRHGVVDDETRRGSVERLANIDAKLAAKFLKRLDAIRRPEARRVIIDMRISVGRSEGSFHSSPASYVEDQLRALKGKSSVDPAWRALGALPLAEVPGLTARVSDALTNMFTTGFGYASKEPDEAKRAQRVTAGGAAFAAVFRKIDPELRGELLARVETWPQREVNWLVLHTVMLGMSEKLETREPTAENIGDYEKHWTKELLRSDVVLKFEDASGYESVGSHYNQKNYDDPALIASSLGILNRRSDQGDGLSAHTRHALDVLCGSKVSDPAIDAALRRWAEHGSDDRYVAVFGLIARGANNPPYQPLLKAAAARFEGGGVLMHLRGLHRDGALDNIPPATLSKIVDGLHKHPENDRFPSGWIKYGQSDTIEFIKRIGFHGPKTDAAVAGLPIPEG